MVRMIVQMGPTAPMIVVGGEQRRNGVAARISTIWHLTWPAKIVGVSWRAVDQDLAGRRWRAEAGSGLAGCWRVRGCGLEGQEISNADGPQYLPLDRPDTAPGLVVVQARCGHLDDAPAGPQLAAAGRRPLLTQSVSGP